MKGRGRFRRLATVRARTTLLATVVVAAVLAAGSFGLIALLRASLTEGVENTLSAQASNVASLLRVGPLPKTLPAEHTDTFTQVVGRTGELLARSSNIEGQVPVSRADPGEEGIVLHRVPGLISSSDDDSPGDDEIEGPYLLLGRTVPATLAGGQTEDVTVYVGGSLKPVEQGTRPVGFALLGGVPVLVLLAGVLVWRVAGRALRPVEAIRAEVADITGHNLHRRVPEPPSRDEIARLARTMNEMLDRLAAAAASQRRFVADASHELRSPLAATQTMLEVALAHPKSADWPAVTAEALDELRRLHTLVEDLLALARVEEPLTQERAGSVDLDELVLRDRRHRSGSRVAIDLRHVSGGRVWGDAASLARVIRNLMDNAENHAHHRVQVEVRTGGDIVELAISDDGPGVPPAERERIFERFARLNESRGDPGGGTGLGLAIVREIVLAHGGTIHVEDASPGARFVIRLPAYPG